MEDSPLKWRVGPTGQHIEMGIAEMNLVLLLGQLGLTLGLPARAALADRHALRPVRDARPRGHRLLDLLGRALRPRRHAVRDLALARGRRAPVAHHAGDRHRDARAHLRRAVLRPRARVAAPRRARPAAGARTASRSTSASRRSRSTRRRSPRPSRRRARTSCAPTSSRAASACASRGPPRRTASSSRRAARWCRRRWPPRSRSPTRRASRRPSSALEPRPPLPRLAAGPHRAAARRAPRRPRTSSGSCSEPSAGFPSSPSSTASSHALSWLGSALGTRCVPLGVDRFGQTGIQPELYAEYGIDPDSIVTAALVALEP